MINVDVPGSVQNDFEAATGCCVSAVGTGMYPRRGGKNYSVQNPGTAFKNKKKTPYLRR